MQTVILDTLSLRRAMYYIVISRPLVLRHDVRTGVWNYSNTYAANALIDLAFNGIANYYAFLLE
jgi:hypothetical protein